MQTRSRSRRLTSAGKIVLLLSMLLLLAAPSLAFAAPPAHSVRGHGIWSLTPPSGIDQISINASVDSNGIVTGGMAVWPSIYLAPPDMPPPTFAGWTWHMEINQLAVTGNVATLHATIVSDNRDASNIGCQLVLVVTDNGNSPSNPDRLEFPDSPPCVFARTDFVVGGNFTVN